MPAQLRDSEAHSTGALDWLIEHGLDACELDDRTRVHDALAFVRPSVRQRDPACLAVQAALERFEGRIDTAIKLYERALSQALDARLEIRIRENLAQLLLSRREDAKAESVLASATLLENRGPCILSLEAALRARRRDRRAIDDLQTLESQLALLTDLECVRVYRRMASVAYEGLLDTGLAMRYMQLAIEHAEAAGAHTHAAVAYWALFSWYSTDVGDNARALAYAEAMADAATKAADKGLIGVSLVLRTQIAFETGNKLLLESLRKALHEAERSERYIERLGVVVANAFSYGWAGDFVTMRQYLLSVEIGRIVNPQRALYHAVMAIAHAGSGYESEALKEAYRSLAIARPLPKETVWAKRIRFIARFLSACVLLRYDRRTEAVRVLKGYESQMTPSLTCLRDAVLDGQYDNVRERAPDAYGYALLCESFKRSGDLGSSQTGIDLTEREIAILRASSRGRPAKVIAEELAISEKTVNWHRGNLLKKLGVKTTIAAIAKGRDLQIIS
jgi:DNA-binding CsgD family transcriptional regulator/tetratricopeptide (TPR) repeat protein